MKDFFQSVMLAVALTLTLPLYAQNYNIQLRSTVDFPGQTLANICGYAQDGREYALVGASQGMVIVDITDPDNPVQIVQIPGPNNLWKEIKTYSHYAYVTSEGGGGVQIVDLSKLPSPVLDYHNYNGTGTIDGQLNTIHALHIDVTKGFLYTYGGSFRGALVHDLNADPYNPTYSGRFDQLDYVHDGFVDNDTLYACHIYAGDLSIVDMTDKQKPVLLGTVKTPGKFTHNSWLLDDHKHILTTDEEYPSFLTAYDISDPTDIRELDRIARDEGTQSIGHNTHVLNDYAITSWYADGMTIVDAHRPNNLIQVGRYDTWTGTGKFDGCWGVYPFLPSGNLIATNIPTLNGGVGQLFVLSPTYVRACYLEGQIIDGCNGLPIIGADIKINSTDPLAFTKSDNSGIFRTGQPTPGNFTVTISRPGYVTQTLNVTLETAKVTPLSVALELPGNAPVSNITGTVVRLPDGVSLGNTVLKLVGASSEYQIVTNAQGQFSLNCVDNGAYRVAAWGYRVTDAVVNGNGVVNIALEPDYYDDFELDLGWLATGDASTGQWERGKPVGTTTGGGNGQQVNPGTDANGDNNDRCYVTGNGGGSSGTDDVDDGTVILTSPSMRLANDPDPVLTFWYWFYNGGGTGTPPNDYFEAKVTNGQETVTLLTQDVSASQWRYSGDIHLKDFIALTDNVKVQFVAADDDPGHFVEAAVDIFQVSPGVVGTVAPDAAAQLVLAPNPTMSDFRLQFDWPNATNPTLEVRNLLGQVVITRRLAFNSGIVRFGESLPEGVYVVVLRSNGRQSAAVKAIKQ